MAFDFYMPDIGEGVVEGEVVGWKVKVGDKVKLDQPLVEVMTDKATVSVPAPVAGKIVKTYGAEGEIAKVHHRLADVEVAGAAPKQPNGHAPVAEAPKAAPPVAAAAPKSNEKVLATPVTRRIASEHGIDLSTVAGTGPQGRVLKSDVEAVISGGGAPAPVAARPAQTFAPLASTQADQRIPMRGMRKRIAEKMVKSKFTAPHYAFVEEVDVSHAAARSGSRYSPLRLVRLALHVVVGFWPQPVQWIGTTLGIVCSLASAVVGV